MHVLLLASPFLRRKNIGFINEDEHGQQAVGGCGGWGGSEMKCAAEVGGRIRSQETGRRLFPLFTVTEAGSVSLQAGEEERGSA